MTRTIPTSGLRDMALERGGGRSPAYKYIWANYRRLVRSKVGVRGGVSWDAFASTLASQGLTNMQGGPLSVDSARQIFKRVSRDFRAEQDAKKTTSPRFANPSRMPATWRPTVVEPSRAADPRRHTPPTTGPSRAAPKEMSEKVRAELASFQSQLDYRDRHLLPPKRKD